LGIRKALEDGGVRTMQLDFLLDEKLYKRLDKLGDPLSKLDAIMDWTPFVSIIEEQRPDKTNAGKGGRPPIKSSILFKGLLIGEIYNLSDAQLEYQITDRTSFSRFCGLGLGEFAPDANSFWLLREKLKETGNYEKLFQTLLSALSSVGLEYSKCAIVDATFVDAPRRRNLRKEQYKALKEHDKSGGELPFELDKERITNLESHLPETDRTQTHKLRQTDIDARWAKKGEETHYGYKDHVVADARTKLIIAHEVTSANVHDSQELVNVVPEDTEEVYDDAGYVGEEIDSKLKEKCPDVEHFTCAKGQKNKPLTHEQKEYNRKFVSHIRSRVEHVFGRMTYCMGNLTVRVIGIARAKCKITLRDFAYNIMRYATLVKLNKAKKMIA
jgi:IS5 family transposase